MCCFVSCSLLQHKTLYKKTVYTRNVSVALNVTDSLNVTESKMSINLSRVLHTVQVGGCGKFWRNRKQGVSRPNLYKNRCESRERPSAFLMLLDMHFHQQETVEETVPMSGSSAGVNALGLVVFSMCFGLVIGNMKQEGQSLRDFFDCLNEAIMRLVAIIIW